MPVIQKIDNVSIYPTKTINKYQLRWYCNSKQEKLTITGFDTAQAVALSISKDTRNGVYHPRDYYDPRKALKEAVIDEQYNYLDFLWATWLNNGQTYAQNSVKNTQSRVTKFLSKLDKKQLHLENANDFLIAYRSLYSDATIYRDLNDIIYCVNYWVKLGKVKHNPYPAIKSQLKPNKNDDNKGRFLKDEQNAITHAFISTIDPTKDDGYMGYYNLVEFLFMTGLRPEECIPLTWGDIKSLVLSINKTYSNNELRFNTKQGKKDKVVHRKYVMNEEQRHFLDSVYEKASDTRFTCYGSLIFPSPNNCFIDWHNFTNRHWKPIINNLVEQGRVRKYLKPYCMRHTAITNMINQKVPLHIVATQCGTSIQMIVKTYLVSSDWWCDDMQSDLSEYESYISEYS